MVLRRTPANGAELEAMLREELAAAQREAAVEAPATYRTGVVKELADGEVFSVDGGKTWYVFAVHGFDTLSVYYDERRDQDADTVRVDADEDDACLVGVSAPEELPELTARQLSLASNVLGLVAHVVGNTNAGAIGTLMNVITYMKRRFPGSFDDVPEAALFADAVQAMHEAGVDSHNCNVDPFRRADAISAASAALRQRSYALGREEQAARAKASQADS